MTVAFKSLVSSPNVNNAFVSRLQDTVQIGRYTLANTLSGATINNLQQAVNKLFFDTGVLGETNTNSLVYTAPVFIANGDNYKTAINKLDTELGFAVTQINGLDVRVTDLESGTIRLREYISDAAYETANGTPTGGEIYYNSTTGRVRYYDATTSQWRTAGAEFLGVQEFLGIGNDMQTTFAITSAPINIEAINVFKNGILVEKSDWTYSAPNVIFTNPPILGERVYVSYITQGTPANPPVNAGSFIVVYKILSTTDIANKKFTLSITPSTPSQVILDVIGGTSQFYSVDYDVINTNELNWASLALDGILSVGDILRVWYFS